MVTQARINALRMQRQHFDDRIDREVYQQLFRLMSPVMPEFWSMPGNPPVIQHRADFSDFQYNDKLRSRREIVKGRFQNGSIAYVYFDELELFAALYHKPLTRMNQEEHRIMELLEHEGPINVKGMKEILSMYVKDITPILHRLQLAYKVFEDQRSVDWDRGWYAFEREFPEFNIQRYSYEEALKTLILRFQQLMGWFEITHVQSFYRLPLKNITAALTQLVDSGQLIKVEVDEKIGFTTTSDWNLLNDETLFVKPLGTFCINRSDFYAKALEAELKVRFPKAENEPMFYILHDGDLVGCVMGHFKIGPNIIEDVVFDRQQTSMQDCRNQVLKAIGKVADLSVSPVLRYQGVKL